MNMVFLRRLTTDGAVPRDDRAGRRVALMQSSSRAASRKAWKRALELARMPWKPRSPLRHQHLALADVVRLPDQHGVGGGFTIN
jgi:hypothetical protein